MRQRLRFALSLVLLLLPGRVFAYGNIDMPTASSTVSQPFTISGWEVDFGGTTGTGIDDVEVYVCPTSCTGSNAQYMGSATYGLSRADVAAAFGDARLTNSGYTFTATGLGGGWYVAVMSAHSYFTGVWTQHSVAFYVTPVAPHMNVDTPADWSSVSQPFTISGWALDTGAASGSGVDDVEVWAYQDPGSGHDRTLWGHATLGVSRPDVAGVYGSQFANAGFTLTVSGQPNAYDQYTVWAHTTTGVWQGVTQTAVVGLPTEPLTIDRQGMGTGSVSAGGLSCPGGSGTQALPCGSSYLFGTEVTLTATPDAGSTFVGWAGACTGTAPCVVWLGRPSYVAAIFNQVPTSFTTSYYHTDVIGSVRAITDASGVPVIRHDYAAFGEDTLPVAGDPIRFGGKELDPETAMAYFGARYYRQTWGRFATADPMFGDAANPQSFNRYAFVLNNPLRVVDPTGLSPEDPSCKDPGYDSKGVWSATNACVDDRGYGFTGPGGRARGPWGTLCDTELVDGTIYSYFNCDAPGTSASDSDSGGVGGGGDDSSSTPSTDPGTTTPPDTKPDPPPPNPPLPPVCSPAVSSDGLSGYLDSVLDVAGMTLQFFLGLGQAHTFGPNSVESAQMSSSPGVEEAISHYESIGRASGRFTFGLKGLFGAGINPTRQFVGSYNYTISPGRNGFTVTLKNVTSFTSLMYGMAPDWQRSTFRPLGDIGQTYQIAVSCR